jgi:predicted GNAT family N-acyltransferase
MKMLHETLAPSLGVFRQIAYTTKIEKCLRRSNLFPPTPERGCWVDLQPVIDRARLGNSLASDEVIRKLLAKNRNIVSVIGTGEQAGIFAYLPLNADGVAALLSGQLDGQNPQPDFICAAGEMPGAIYLWYVYFPGSLARSLAAVAQKLNDAMSAPCPIFSKALGKHAARLNRTAGFAQARDFYPGCPAELLVIFPKMKVEKPAKQRITIEIARSVEDIFKVFSVRSATYLAEQFCLYGEEFDGNDFCATHFLGTIGGDAAGCLRIRFFDGFAKIERLAVRAEYRNSRLAFQLVRAAIEHCRMKGYRKLYGHSRADLVRFWSMFGFRPRRDRPEFAFAQVRYIEMICDTPPSAAAITIDSNPMRLIRPEGAWDLPGPFDLSNGAVDPRKARLLASRTRTVNHQRVDA